MKEEEDTERIAIYENQGRLTIMQGSHRVGKCRKGKEAEI